MTSYMINSLTMPLAGISPFTSTPNKSPQMLGLLGALGSSVIGGISNLISGNKQVKAQKEINAQQIALQREQMDLQQKQFQQQLDYQTMDWNRNRQAALEDWQRETEYNDPGAQMARYSAAGLNPYLMMQGQNAAIGSMESTAGGSSPSPGSMPGIPNLQAPDYTTLGRSVGDAFNNFMNYRLQNEQLEQLSIDNSTRFMSNMMDIANKIADIDVKLSQSGLNDMQRQTLEKERDTLQQQYEFFESTWYDRMNGIKYDNYIKFKHSEELDESVEQQRFETWLLKNYGEERVIKELEERGANIASLYACVEEAGSRVRLNDANASKVYAEECETWLRANNINPDSEEGKRYQDFLESQIFHNYVVNSGSKTYGEYYDLRKGRTRKLIKRSLKSIRH